MQTSKPNLQVVHTIAEKGKEYDRNKQYQDALDFYAEALERFIAVWDCTHLFFFLKPSFCIIDFCV